MKLPDSEVSRYLNKYSIKGTELIWRPDNEITTAVVVPAIKEYDNIEILLNSLLKNEPYHFKNTLFIFVINNLPSSNSDVKEDNRKSIELLKNIVNKSPENNFIDCILKSGLKVGFIDSSSSGKELPEKDGGVGLARKIGMDAALNILNYENRNKAKILICLDADCTVKENYLAVIHKYFYDNKIKAASIYFEHNLANSGEDDKSAIICYEIFLRYYVMGLRFSGSNYSFHTIGSAMACDHQVYIKTEGMNKKKAAEDFYFLEKISKHTQIYNIKDTTVYPSERKSWRVPFGTGQRVTRFHAKTHEEYFLYNPTIFEILKEWLYIFHSEEILSPEKYLLRSKSVCIGLFEFLKLQNFNLNYSAILKSSKSEAQIRIQQLRWFDGFRTLKMIHFLRDNYFPNINMFEALDIMLPKCDVPFLNQKMENIPGREIQLQYLERLRFLDRN